MKILLIDVNYKYSSTGKIVSDLYTYINNAPGFEAAVCYGRGKKVKEKNVYKFGLDFETKIHALLARLTGFNGCFSYFSTRRLIRFIKKYKPDVIHIHELHAYFVNYIKLLKFVKKLNVKVIHTLHCEYSYTGKCGYSYECEKWKTCCGKCPHKKDYPSSLFFDKTKRMYLKKKETFLSLSNLILTTPSEWTTNRAKQSFFKNNKIITIHNGIDSSIFFPKDSSYVKEKYNLNNEKIVFSIANKLMTEVKGGDYILKIADRVKELPVKFIMVGVNPNEIHMSNIIALENINDKELISKLYSAADLFLLPSKKETFSLTCAESISCGTPVIGFECGAPETIYEKPYAQFIKYGDIDKLTELLISSLNLKNSIDCASYGKKFSNLTMCEKYFELYKNE